jgi:hypothetical protein
MTSEYQRRLEGTRKKYPMAYRLWTEAEDILLKKLFNSGATTRELSEVFKRQPSAIRSRLEKFERLKYRSKSQKSVKKYENKRHEKYENKRHKKNENKRHEKNENKRHKKQYYSDENLSEMVKRLNAFYGEKTWSYSKAYRKHTGLFGEAIQEGEKYFKIRFGDNNEKLLKLSRNSMDRILYLLFAPNPNLITWADKLQDRMFQKKRYYINQLRK